MKKLLKIHEKIVKDTIHTEPPRDKNTPCIDLNEGVLVLVGQKKG